jgi:hypothetical protein
MEHQMFSKNHRYLVTASIILASALMLHACTTGPKIFGNANPDLDFSLYKTYNYQAVLDTDKEAGTRSILSTYLVNAVDREMQARGYKKAENPDLEIQFSLYTKEKISSRSSPGVSTGYYGYRGRGGYGGSVAYSETQITQYTEGTLNIDLVDNVRDQLAWEGVAVGKIRDKARENLEAAANEVVGQIFQKYPYNAAGFVPPQPAGQ